MTLDEINVLGNLLNTTFGRSSTVVSPTESITGSLDGDLIVLKLVTVMRLFDRTTHRRQVDMEREMSKKKLLAHVKNIEEALNKQCGCNYKLKEIDCSDFVQPVVFRPDGVPSDTIFRMTLVCEPKWKIKTHRYLR